MTLLFPTFFDHPMQASELVLAIDQVEPISTHIGSRSGYSLTHCLPLGRFYFKCSWELYYVYNE